MTLDIDRYKELKSKVEELQKNTLKAQGAYDEIMGRIKGEYGCTTMSALKTLTKKARREADIASVAFNKAMEEFDKEWDDALSGTVQDGSEANSGLHSSEDKTNSRGRGPRRSKS